jgi:hypothetical protein
VTDLDWMKVAFSLFCSVAVAAMFLFSWLHERKRRKIRELYGDWEWYEKRRWDNAITGTVNTGGSFRTLPARLPPKCEGQLLLERELEKVGIHVQ